MRPVDVTPFAPHRHEIRSGGRIVLRPKGQWWVGWSTRPLQALETLLASLLALRALLALLTQLALKAMPAR